MERGTVSIGKAGDTSYSSAKNVTTTALTFGADKRYENNIMRGIALRLGNDEVEVGNIGSALDIVQSVLLCTELIQKVTTNLLIV